MARNSSNSGQTSDSSSMLSLLDNFKSTLEAEDRKIQDLRRNLQVKEVENAKQSKRIIQLEDEVEKLKKKLIEAEARKEGEVENEKKMMELGRLILTSLKISFGGSINSHSNSKLSQEERSWPEMFQSGNVVDEKGLKDVMAMICSSSGSSRQDSNRETIPDMSSGSTNKKKHDRTPVTEGKVTAAEEEQLQTTENLRESKEDNRWEQERRQKWDTMRDLAGKSAIRLKSMLFPSTEEWLRKHLTPTNITGMISIYDKLLMEVQSEVHNYVDSTLWKRMDQIIDERSRESCTDYLKEIHDRVNEFGNGMGEKIGSHVNVFIGSELEKMGREEYETISKNVPPDQSEINKLVKIGCDKLMEQFRTENSKNKRVQEEVKGILEKSKSSYVARMKEVVQKNPEGVEENELRRKDEEIVNEIRKLLEMEIRQKVGQDRSLESHVRSFQGHVDSHRKYVMGANQENWMKKKVREQQNRIRLDEERKKALRSKNPLPPLVYQLQHNRVKMGMLIDDKPQVLKNSSREDSTPFIVGLNNGGDLIFGSEVVANINMKPKARIQSPLLKHWWVAEYFISSEKGPWTENIHLSGENDNSHPWVLHKITVEFLLASILKELKEHVEVARNGSCSVAVITVPRWFCSTQRIQVKDGGRLAGFAEIHLVNEASAAAFYCCSSTQQHSLRTAQNSVIIVSENSEQVDVSGYSFSTEAFFTENDFEETVEAKGKLTALIRPRYSPPNSVGGTKRTGTSVFHRALFGANRQSSKDDKLQPIRDDYEEMLSLLGIPVGNCANPHRPAPRGYSHIDPFGLQKTSTNKQTLLIFESDKWKPILEKIVKEYGETLCSIASENAVVFGAALLSKNLAEIKIIIKDTLANELYHKAAGVASGGYSPLNQKELPVGEEADCIWGELMPRYMTASYPGGGEIFQYVNGGNVPVASFQFHGYSQRTSNNTLLYNVSHEAIFELVDQVLPVPVPRMLGQRKQEAPTKAYSWTTPNLTPEDIARLQSLLESVQLYKRRQESKAAIMKEMTNKIKAEEELAKAEAELAKAEAQAQAELMKVKREFFDKCKAMKEQLDSGTVFKFKSSIVRDMLSKRIEEANRFAEDPNSTAKQIQEHMDTLEKWSSKYIK